MFKKYVLTSSVLLLEVLFENRPSEVAMVAAVEMGVMLRYSWSLSSLLSG